MAHFISNTIFLYNNLYNNSYLFNLSERELTRTKEKIIKRGKRVEATSSKPDVFQIIEQSLVIFYKLANIRVNM